MVGLPHKLNLIIQDFKYRFYGYGYAFKNENLEHVGVTDELEFLTEHIMKNQSRIDAFYCHTSYYPYCRKLGLDDNKIVYIVRIFYFNSKNERKFECDYVFEKEKDFEYFKNRVKDILGE